MGSTDSGPVRRTHKVACVDGNEAAARVAHRLSDVCAIYPITPATSMGELADAWSAGGRTNLWGAVPEVVEMQSEGGAAAALHGALQKGTLATSFTASQGLLLMVPTMFKVGGEATPTVLHVAARAIATHALSIFGDHSDVMSVRSTGWAMLSGADVQEAQDLALVAHAATLRARVPFLHFFDGFRTSAEVATIDLLDDDDLRALVREEDVLAHRAHGLTPESPVLRGSAQNPDVFFQSREAANPRYDAVPGIVAEVMAELGGRTGREYHLVDYHGHPEADRVVVAMGSATGTLREVVDASLVLVEEGCRLRSRRQELVCRPHCRRCSRSSSQRDLERRELGLSGIPAQLRTKTCLELPEESRRTNAHALCGVRRGRRRRDRRRRGQPSGDHLEGLVERTGELEQLVFGQSAAKALLQRSLAGAKDESRRRSATGSGTRQTRIL